MINTNSNKDAEIYMIGVQLQYILFKDGFCTSEVCIRIITNNGNGRAGQDLAQQRHQIFYKGKTYIKT